MEQLKKIYGEYLASIGKFDEDIRLGRKIELDKREAKDAKDIVKTRTESLTKRLEKRFKFNNRIIVLAIIFLCLIFGIGVFLIFYYRDSLTAMGGIFGGTFLSLLSIIHWLHKLWREKSLMDISLTVLEGLPPKQAVDFISIFYWRLRGR